MKELKTNELSGETPQLSLILNEIKDRNQELLEQANVTYGKSTILNYPKETIETGPENEISKNPENLVEDLESIERVLKTILTILEKANENFRYNLG